MSLDLGLGLGSATAAAGVLSASGSRGRGIRGRRGSGISSDVEFIADHPLEKKVQVSQLVASPNAWIY